MIKTFTSAEKTRPIIDSLVLTELIGGRIMMTLGFILTTGIGTLVMIEVNEMMEDKKYKDRNKETRQIKDR